MIRLEIKPLSVNQAWQGRRYKTKKYKAYEEQVGWLLKKYNHVKFIGYIEIHYKWYFKNLNKMDYDNPIKLLQDLLVKSGIIQDDRYIIRAVIDKIKSDTDYIEIYIKEIENIDKMINLNENHFCFNCIHASMSKQYCHFGIKQNNNKKKCQYKETT